jgi:IS4 transposase
MVFSTVPAGRLRASEVLEWYRVRWQIELAFKRLKTLAAFGARPKHDAQSARAWLYGKLLVALLALLLS